MSETPPPAATARASDPAEACFRDDTRFAGSALDALPLHVVVLDHDGTIVRVNEAWRAFAQGSGIADSFTGWNYLTVCDGADGACSDEAHEVARGIRNVLAERSDLFTLEYPCHAPTQQHWFFLRAAPFVEGGERYVVVSHENVTERKLAELALQRSAETDLLTGLVNRRVMNQAIEAAVACRRRREGYLFAVYFLDLDRFKLVNDSIGHDAGDALLIEIADRCRAALDHENLHRLAPEARATIGRFGGDEFVVLIENLDRPAQVAELGEHLLAHLSPAHHLEGHEIVSPASIGIATPHGRETSAADLLRNADTAMYAAKRSGKNRCVRYDEIMREQVVTQLTLESELRNSIERDQLALAYQPLLALDTGRVVAFEALLRWNHPDLGAISPGDFIPIAEETGLIVPIGDWVLDTACRQLAAWRQRLGRDDLAMNVNISRKQIALPDLADRVRACVDRHGIPPERLVCEITENAIQVDPYLARETLHRIRAHGTRIAADDFGTGHSSLASLHSFPLDILKLDRTFIHNLSERRDYGAVVHAVITLAHNLGMAVTAEGIEERQQLVTLQALDCDTAQGFYFSKPLPAEQAGAAIDTGFAGF